MRAPTPQPQSRRALTTLTLGLAQAIAASSWSNFYGVIIGGVAFAVGAALSLAAPARAGSSSALLATQPPPRWARRFAQALSAFVLVLLLVRLASSPDPSVSAFPDSCPPGLQGRHGCSRVALDNAHRAPPQRQRPFRARAALADVEAELLRWLARQPRVAILRHVRPGTEGSSSSSSSSSSGGFLHARAVTPLMGYADDVFVRYRCTRAGEALVEVQGQLRLGVGDAGVNVARNAALLGHLAGARIPSAAWCR